MSPLDSTEARLTAHALGELPSAEAEAIDAAGWRDPAIRETIDAVRAVAEQLAFSFAAEVLPSLTPAQQRTVLESHRRLTGTPEKEARLTAFALGELRPSQAEALSARLAEDRAAALEMEAVGALAEKLRAAFADEPTFFLRPTQRDEIFARGAEIIAAAESASLTSVPAERVTPPLETAARRHPRDRSWRPVAAMAAAAATLVIGGFVANYFPTARPTTARRALLPPEGPMRDEFPIRPGDATAAAASPRLQALIDRETRRPSIPTAIKAPLPTPAPASLLANADSPESAPPVPIPFAPRRQPDASFLPPARAAVLRDAPTMAPRPTGRSALMTFGSSRAGLPLRHRSFFETRESSAATVPADLGRASYDALRQCVRDFGVRPPSALVRPEEVVNHFDYDARPAPGQDFAVAIEAATCPWNEAHQLVRVTVAARDDGARARPLRLTYFLRLADTEENERAQLLFWQGLQALLPLLGPDDSIAVVVWGRARGLVLPPSAGWQSDTLRDALQDTGHWHRGGDTSGGTDWSTVEDTVRRQAVPGALNRCLVVTDGPLDFTGDSLDPVAGRLSRLGASLAVAELGPLQPDRSGAHQTMEFFQADSGPEAARLFAREAVQPTADVARNVRIDVQFHAEAIHSWRPVGFESADQSAGARSRLAPATATAVWRAGHQVTALYEIVPLALSPVSVMVGPSHRFNRRAGDLLGLTPAAPLSVRVRYQLPDGPYRREITTDWTTSGAEWRAASADFRLAAAAAAFALRLQGDPAACRLAPVTLHQLVESSTAPSGDPFGLRREFADLVAATERVESP